VSYVKYVIFSDELVFEGERVMANRGA